MEPFIISNEGRLYVYFPDKREYSLIWEEKRIGEDA